MHRPLRRTFHTALVAAALTTPVAALAHDGVHVDLTAYRVDVSAEGKEILVADDRVKPGELLEYHVTCYNDYPRSVRNLAATLPIPPGTEYVAHTADPVLTMASLDGEHYEAVPLWRPLCLQDGRAVMRRVSSAEYRFLRWTIGILPGHHERELRARVWVIPLAAASPAR